jgi:hypothetical protein
MCGFDRVVEYCHVIPARDFGTVHPDNIICLCPNHHTLMDKGLLNLEEQSIADDALIWAWASEHSLHANRPAQNSDDQPETDPFDQSQDISNEPYS